MANYVYVMARMLHFCISSPSLAVVGKHGKRHAMPAHKLRAVSDWLNPDSLGTMSAHWQHCKFSLKFNLFNNELPGTH